MTDNSVIEFFHTEDGKIDLDVMVRDDTVWLTQKQMVSLFDRERSVVTKHINNLFVEEELQRDAVCAKFAHTAKDNKNYQVTYYNLDVIISVGYRIKSKIGTKFRIWATDILKQNIIKGYSINLSRFEDKQKDILSLISLLENTSTYNAIEKDEVVELIKIVHQYSKSFELLLMYDEDRMSKPKGIISELSLSVPESRQVIDSLRNDLARKGQATELFAKERDEAFIAIIENIDQTFEGKYLYSTVQSKAAHLLYFIVKDHPFYDGNKRCAAFMFLYYLARHGLLNTNINNSTIVALTLLIAESDPNQKDLMIMLIHNLL